MKKRCTKVFLAVIFSFMVLAAPVQSSAEGSDLVTKTEDVRDMLYQEGGFGFVSTGESAAEGEESDIGEGYFPGYLAAEPDIEGAKAAILAGLRGFQESISLAEYKIPREMLKEMYVQLVNDNADLFYVTGGYSYSYSSSSGCVTAIRPGYKSGIEMQQVQAFEAKVGEIIQKCIFSGMSEEEKALSLHDYLVSHCVYDLTYTKYDAYSAIMEGQAVCQGYALAYCNLLSRAGIEAKVISSDAMRHAWNQVKIDGDWYHVDATWDDPVRSSETFSDASPLHPATGCIGRSRHGYFLLSDSGIQDSTHNHYGWTSELKCTSTKYDSGAYWTSLETPVIFLNSDKYVLRPKNKGMELVKNDTNVLLSEDCIWHVVGSSSYWVGCFTGFSYENGVFYYNTSNEVKGYELSTGKVESVYTHTDASSNLYSCFADNGVLTIFAANKPSTYQAEDRVWQMPLTKEEPVTPLAITTQPAAVEVKEGAQATFTVAATGDGLTYQWQLCYEGDTVFRKCTFPGADTASLTVDATKARNGYSFRCVVTDKNGQSVTSEAAKLTVKSEVALGVSLTASQSTADPGEMITFTAVGNGGDGNYQYKFIINDTANDKWYKLQDYSANNTIQWKATTAGTKRIMVDIKDGTGKSVGKNVAVVVNGVPELSATFTASSYEVNSGDMVTLTANGLGGSGKYNYKFIINDKTDDKWYRLQDFGANNTIQWKATTPGTKRLMVDVMDSNGKKFGTNVTITVK